MRVLAAAFCCVSFLFGSMGPLAAADWLCLDTAYSATRSGLAPMAYAEQAGNQLSGSPELRKGSAR